MELHSEDGATVLPIPQTGRLRLGEIKELRNSPKITPGCCPLWNPESVLSAIHPPGAPQGQHHGPRSWDWKPGLPRGSCVPLLLLCPCTMLFSAYPRVSILPPPFLPSLSWSWCSGTWPASSAAPGQRGGRPTSVYCSLSPDFSLSSFSPERVSPQNTHTVSKILPVCQALDL